MYHRITGYSYLSIVADAFIAEGYKNLNLVSPQQCKALSKGVSDGCAEPIQYTQS